MAELGQLKKRLRSIELSRQLAGAMRTVASAKYARLNRRFATDRKEREALEAMLLRCGGALSPAPPEAAPRTCYLVLGYGRGFCGGYNAELHAYADRLLAEAPDALLLVNGRVAITHFAERGRVLTGEYTLPDVPQPEDCSALLAQVLELYGSGQVCRVQLIMQHFVNTLKQTPTCLPLLPLTERETVAGAAEPLCLPDPETVRAALWRRAVEGRLYGAVLEAAVGAQAATLAAMRTAFDNATEAAEQLEHEMNKMRQSAVTSGVIETASGAFYEDEEEEHGGWR